MASRPHFLAPLLRHADDRCELWVIDGEAPVATTLEGAFDSASRTRGLLGRDGLAAGAALAIAPCNAVHTFFMRFSIDVVFAARDGRVLKIRRAMRPWRMALAIGAFAAVELTAGGAAASGVRVGDRLVVREGTVR